MFAHQEEVGTTKGFFGDTVFVSIGRLEIKTNIVEGGPCQPVFQFNG